MIEGTMPKGMARLHTAAHGKGRSKEMMSNGGTSGFWKSQSIKSTSGQPGNPSAKGEKRLPSQTAHVSSEKAKKILKDGTVRGHPLTKKQKGMFGAIAGGD